MRVSSGDFIRQFGTYTDTALTEPVIITKNGRERLVLLSIDEYNLLIHLRDQYEDSQQAAPDTARKEAGKAAPRRTQKRRA